jgi:putative salt-induced outer membrane protein YdiY
MIFERTGFMHAVVVAAITVSPLAQGQENDNDNWEGEAELGVLITSGNTEETIVNSRLGLKHEEGRWRNLGEFSSTYSESKEATTAEQYEAMAETNYRFHEQNFWFVRGEYEDDRFSGYDFESSATTGYGNRVWKRGKRSFLDLSVGAGYRYNKLEMTNAEGEDAEKEAIARLAAKFDYALSDNALFRQKLSTEIGMDESNRITESETSLRANVVGNLSMKAAFRVKHVSKVPANTEKTDTETSLSLLYGF